MVLQKRLDYACGGYRAPAMPHLPRSARGKRSARKKVEDNQTYAFDLLATIAGKLLSEIKSSPSPCNSTGTSNAAAGRDTAKQEQIDEEKSLKCEGFDWLSCNEAVFSPENALEKHITYKLKENSNVPKDTSSGPASPFIKSDLSDEDAIGGDGSRIEHGVGAAAEKCIKGSLSSSSVESYDRKEDGGKKLLVAEQQVAGNFMDRNAPYKYSLDDPLVMDVKPPLVSSDSSVEAPLFRNNISRNYSFPKQEDGMDLAADKDDDENSSGCTHPTPVANKTSRMPRIGDRRIRKLMSSKLRKVAPTVLQDAGTSNYDVEQKPALRGKRMCYTRQRTQRSSFKRRKLFDHCPVSPYDGGIYGEGLSKMSESSRIKLETDDSHATLCGANGASSLTTGQNCCYESPDYHVKLSIKSFKVPELVIEIPETATVGSLKRTVLEAVTAILGGRPRVGVLQEGKKVRDDNKTLRQAGITYGDKLDNLSFTMEPNPEEALVPPPSSEDPDFLGLACAPEPLARMPPIAPAAAAVDQRGPDSTESVQTCPEMDHDSFHSPIDPSSPEKTTASALALVAVPPMDVEALAMVPLGNKPKRSETPQRRVRRPFSVAEVEALVLAVENLGTGRWRDVKLRAFENAKHRTYVDLKDKWKTLVHTARISPQQRRGEPVPQELLDRVLSAHSSWSQKQAKLLLKPPAPLLTSQ
ncbi:telomere repeat-binding protein 5 [Musa acuminata AAA Group]|uniref:telomere repeat-binding protein 5 n=1 Tax=Musa acuminata AAA Group TaxID=214697 RepID=UPI0031DAD25A